MKKISIETRLTITINGEKVTAPAHILNTLSLYAGEASYKLNNEHCYGLGSDALNIRDQIYEQLKARGLYD